jgi:hypothetical protein
MFEWLMLLAPVTYAELPKKDCVGMVAAEAAYVSFLPDAIPPKVLVDTKDCTRCNRTGRIPTGDSNNPWTDCPECEPKDGKVNAEPKLSPVMKLQKRAVPDNCASGTCPIPANK